MTDKWRKRARYWRQRARIEKADRKHFQADLVVLRRSSVVMHNALKENEALIKALSEREAAALKQVEACRQLGREMDEQLLALLAWQRRVREACSARDDRQGIHWLCRPHSGHRGRAG